jgi:hypothetical protein
MYKTATAASFCGFRKLALSLTILASFLLLAAQAIGQNGTDVSSGLFWGTISYFAGGGTVDFSNGVLATDLTSLQSFAVAIDSQGNVYLQTGGQASGNSIYMVYEGGAKIPPCFPP